MIRLAVLIGCAAALAASAAGAAGGPVIRADGTIGSFRLDVTTEAQIRALAGKPLRVESVLDLAGTRAVGRTLVYRCGPGCETAYSINRRTRTLSDFTSGSALFLTEHGSHVGMKAWQARRLEGLDPVKACGPGRNIRIRWDAKHHFLLHEHGGTIDAIAYFGPHTVFPGGC